MNLMEAARLTEDEARSHLEKLRWPNGPQCPHCLTAEVTRMQGKSHRRGLFQCKDCRGQFTVTTGSIMESSKVSLTKWIMAFHLCSSKKGYSALQLKRDLGLGSYKTAWFMAHRIRHAMSAGPLAQLLQGEVEVDETYVGGKPRHNKGL